VQNKPMIKCSYVSSPPCTKEAYIQSGGSWQSRVDACQNETRIHEKKLIFMKRALYKRPVNSMKRALHKSPVKMKRALQMNPVFKEAKAYKPPRWRPPEWDSCKWPKIPFFEKSPVNETCVYEKSPTKETCIRRGENLQPLVDARTGETW